MSDPITQERDERWLGWWLVRNATRLTITTPWGATLEVSGPNAVADVRQWIAEGQQHDTWRAA